MGGFDQKGQSVGKQTNIQYNTPAPAPESYLSQIPEPVADFVGRGEEIGRLVAAFEGAGRLVGEIAALRSQ